MSRCPRCRSRPPLPRSYHGSSAGGPPPRHSPHPRPHTGPPPPPPRRPPGPRGGPPPPPLPSTPAPQQSPPQPAPQVLHPVTRVDASPLRSVMALWPRNAARQGRIDVQIRVKIDAQGRVVGVTPIDRTVANFPFVDSAMTAARVWTFSPATENGKPIPSESVLTFKFTP